MKTLRNWWQSKTTHKRHNWLLLSLVILYIGSGLVEQFMIGAAIACIPAFTMVYLECSRPA